MNAVPNTSLASSIQPSQLITDETALAGAAEDFGHIVHRRPRAVLRPSSTAEVAKLVQWAGPRRIPVAARGRGHTSFGQAQADNGIVIDLRTLADIQPVAGDWIKVEAGASWHAVLNETLRHGLTPPVLTDYIGLSVGGTLSAGGIGGTTHRYGVQTDTVRDLEIVTGDGAIHTVAADQPLARAALAGLGQCGIITRATLRLVPAPERTRRYKLYYPNARALTTAQRRVLGEGRFDYLEGQILAGEDGWRYMLEAATYYTPPDEPDDRVLIGDLGQLPGTDEIDDRTYLAFADRLGPTEAYLRSTGEWLDPHPWWNAFLPGSTADDFIDELAHVLVPDDLGAPGLVLVSPVPTSRLHTRLFRVPDEPVVFLIALLRFSPPDDPTAIERILTANRRWFDRARSLRGLAYPVGAIPFTADDWREHFGPAFPELAAAKRRYDPHKIFTPGQGIF